MSEATPLPGALAVSCVVEGATARLSLRGELDLASVPQMEEGLRNATQSAAKRVVIDLSRLAFIDSTGLRLLLQADARAREQGYELVLHPGEPTVQRVFEVTGALDVLHFEASPAS
jgi:anti-anti-sigma factor